MTQESFSSSDLHSEVIDKYKETTKKHYMTLDESISLSHYLSTAIAESGYFPERIIGIANGALLPTKIIADDLQLPYSFITIRRKGSSIKSRLSAYPVLVKAVSLWFKIPLLRLPLVFIMSQFTQLSSSQRINPAEIADNKILLIDDSIESGQTLVKAIEILKAENPDCMITTAVLAAKFQSIPEKRGFAPEFYIGETMQHFPWSSNNPEYKRYQRWLREHKLDKDQV